MLVARYRNEAERKRLEYVIDRFRRRLRIEKPGGAVFFLDGDSEDVRAFLEELYSRLPRESIAVYRLDEPGVDVEEKRRSYVVESTSSPGEVWGAIRLIMARLRGSLVSEASGGREYVVRVRGGYARVRFHVSPRSRGSLIHVYLEGYGSGFERIVSSLRGELALLGEVRSIDRG